MSCTIRKVIITFSLLSIFIMPAYSEPAGVLFLNVLPSGSIPFSSTIGGETDDYYRTGGGVGLRCEYILPAFPLFMIGGGFDMNFAPSNPDVTNNESTVPFIAAIGEFGLIGEVAQNFSIAAAALPGYYLYFLDGGTGSGPFIGAELSANYRFSRNFSAGIAAQYKNCLSLTQNSSVYQGVSLGLGVRISFLSSGKSKLEIRQPQFPMVFPVFYKHYDDNPLGEVILRNNESGVIRNITVDFFINQYMDKPKSCAVIKALQPGEEISVPLYALFTDKVLLISEGTKVMGQILTSYEYQDAVLSGERIESVEIQNRNAMIWGDDRKAASFVTARDPRVLNFAKTLSAVAKEVNAVELNYALQTGMAVFEGMGVAGISYAIDPSTPYSEFSASEGTVDFFQFPSQTLQYRAGDCDDLSILYCALLESVGIETSFITVPGHIFAAFKLGSGEDRLERIFSSTDGLIIRGDEVWLPVEVTMIKDGFTKAWKTGAREWRENDAEGKAAFFPIHEAWQIYNPVGILEADSSGVRIPETSIVREAYQTALNTFITGEIRPKRDRLQERIDQNPRKPAHRNQMGILYARYGLLDDAKRELEGALAIEDDYLPALVNLGNVMYVKDDFGTAVIYFERALRTNEKYSPALLGLSKARYEAGDFDGASAAFKELQSVDFATAVRFSYLGSPSEDQQRAGIENSRNQVIWAEE